MFLTLASPTVLRKKRINIQEVTILFGLKRREKAEFFFGLVQKSKRRKLVSYVCPAGQRGSSLSNEDKMWEHVPLFQAFVRDSRSKTKKKKNKNKESHFRQNSEARPIPATIHLVHVEAQVSSNPFTFFSRLEELGLVQSIVI
jgi:hypothetical protein